MTKTVNYSPENETYMREVYDPSASEAERTTQIETIAGKLGKTVASVRSKLSHMQVYVPLSKPEATGKGRILKSDILSEIAANANHPNDQFFDSLAGANRDVLKWVIALQTRVFDLETELDGEADDESADASE